MLNSENVGEQLPHHGKVSPHRERWPVDSPQLGRVWTIVSTQHLSLCRYCWSEWRSKGLFWQSGNSDGKKEKQMDAWPHLKNAECLLIDSFMSFKSCFLVKDVWNSSRGGPVPHPKNSKWNVTGSLCVWECLDCTVVLSSFPWSATSRMDYESSLSVGVY